MIGRITDRRIVTYGFSPQADVRAVNLRFDNRGAQYDIQIADRVRGVVASIDGVPLPMFGRHNVQTSLVEAEIAREMGRSEEGRGGKGWGKKCTSRWRPHD